MLHQMDIWRNTSTHCQLQLVVKRTPLKNEDRTWGCEAFPQRKFRISNSPFPRTGGTSGHWREPLSISMYDRPLAISIGPRWRESPTNAESPWRETQCQYELVLEPCVGCFPKISCNTVPDTSNWAETEWSWPYFLFPYMFERCNVVVVSKNSPFLPQPLGKWSNFTCAYFSKGLVQPPSN